MTPRMLQAMTNSLREPCRLQDFDNLVNLEYSIEKGGLFVLTRITSEHTTAYKTTAYLICRATSKNIHSQYRLLKN